MNKNLLAGCLTALALTMALPTVAATQDSANAAIKAATKAQKKADRKHAEWRDIKKMLKHAQKAVDSGDYAKATKLADMAKFQAEMGMEQAKQQKNAGPLF